MYVLEDDVFDQCLTIVGFDLVVLLAHVCKTWEQSTKRCWPNRPRIAGARLWASSIERFNWAQSIGYPLRGNDLLCAAARVGAVDVVASLASVYTESCPRMLWTASAADELEMTKILAEGFLENFGEAFGAGPKVRAWADSTGRVMFYRCDPATDFRHILDDALPIDYLSSLSSVKV